MIGAVKALLQFVALVATLPFLAWYHLLSRLMPSRRDQVLQGVSQLLSLIPGVTGSFLRVAFYSRVFLRLGKGAHIGFGTIFATPDVSLGERVYVGPFCNIGHADIGDDVLLGSNVTILSGKLQHGFERLDVPINRQGGHYERVRIGDDCWLGNGSIVMAPVDAHSVVAAGSVITRPVAPGDIVAGNPGRRVRNRLEEANHSPDQLPAGP